jgi:acyl dehydratase
LDISPLKFGTLNGKRESEMNLLGEPIRLGQPVHSGEHLITQEAIDFYLDTFGDRHPFYAEDASSSFGGPIAPPLLYHSEVFAHPERWYLKNLVGTLHAEQEWLLYQPFSCGMRVRTRSTLVDRYLKRDREYLVNEVDYQDDDGRLLVRGRTYQSFLIESSDPDESFVVNRNTAKKKAHRHMEEGNGPEIEPLTLQVDRTRCWRFSGPGANYHTDVEAARRFGFPDIVVQGMLSTCLVSQIMANAFGEGWFAGGRMAIKFVNVLWADETVRVRGRVRDECSEGAQRRKTLEVWVEKQDDRREIVVVGTASALV